MAHCSRSQGQWRLHVAMARGWRSTAYEAFCPRPWATLTKQQTTSRTPWRSAAKRATGLSLAGPAVTTPIPYACDWVPAISARALLEHQLGETEAGDAYLNILLENFRAGAFDSGFQANYTVPAVVIPMVSYITGIGARFEFVEDFAQSVFSSKNVNPSAAEAVRIGLALIAAQRGDETAAKELYGALQPIAGTMAPSCSYGPGLAVDRIRGLLSRTMGNLDQASTHFEDALVKVSPRQTLIHRPSMQPVSAWR